MKKRLFVCALAATMLFGSTMGVSATEVSEPQVAEGTSTEEDVTEEIPTKVSEQQVEEDTSTEEDVTEETPHEQTIADVIAGENTSIENLKKYICNITSNKTEGVGGYQWYAYQDVYLLVYQKGVGVIRSSDKSTTFSVPVEGVLGEEVGISDVESYVKSNESDITSIKGDNVFNFYIDTEDGNWMEQIDKPDNFYLLVFDNKSNYVGNLDMRDIKLQAGMYDSFANDTQSTVEIEPSVKVAKDKTSADVSFKFKLSSNLSFRANDTIKTYRIYNADGTEVYTQTDSTKALYGIQGKSSGTVKGGTLYTNGDYYLEICTVSGHPSANGEDNTYIRKISVSGIEDGNNEQIGDEGDNSPATIAFSDIPESVDNNLGLDIIMYSDKPCAMIFNGVSSDGYCTEYTFSVQENGVYNYSARTESGVETTGTLEIKCFKDNASNSDDSMQIYGDGGDTTNLPQTGQTSWSLFICVLSGLFLFACAGMVFCRRQVAGVMSNIAYKVKGGISKWKR